MHQIADFFLTCNYSFNFIIYIVLGKQFRHQLVMMVRCRDNASIQVAPANRMNTMNTVGQYMNQGTMPTTSHASNELNVNRVVPLDSRSDHGFNEIHTCSWSDRHDNEMGTRTLPVFQVENEDGV